MASKYEDLFTELARPFEGWEVKERQGDSGGSRVLHYVDKDTVANRLDEVLGPENWSDDTEHFGDWSICRLTVTLPGGEVVKRSGVGSYIHTSPEAKLKDPANLAAYRAKAAGSDAFKRAAEKLGVGRYLGKSGVPAFARHLFPDPDAPAPREPARPSAPPPPRDERRRADPPQAVPDRTLGDGPHPSPGAVPSTGRQLFGWAKEQGQRRDYDLVAYLGEWGKINGFPRRIVDWTGHQLELALSESERKLASIVASEPVHS